MTRALSGRDADQPGNEPTGDRGSVSDAAFRLVLKIDAEMRDQTGWWGPFDPLDSVTYREIERGPAEQQAEIVRCIMERKAELWQAYQAPRSPRRDRVDPIHVLTSLIKRDLPLETGEILRWIDRIRAGNITTHANTLCTTALLAWPIGLMMKQIERNAKRSGLAAPEVERLEEMLFWPEFSQEKERFSVNPAPVRERIQAIVDKGIKEHCSVDRSETTGVTIEAQQDDLRRLLTTIESEIRIEYTHGWGQRKPSTSRSYQELKAGPLDRKVGMVRLIWSLGRDGDEIFVGLMRGPLPLPPEEVLGWIIKLREKTLANRARNWGNPGGPLVFWPVGLMVQQVERAAKVDRLTPGATAMIEEILTWPELDEPPGEFGSDMPKVKAKLEALFSAARGDDPETRPYLKLSGDDFGESLEAELRALIPKKAEVWNRMFHLAATASAARPNDKFEAQASELQNRVGKEAFRKELQHILERAVGAKVRQVTHRWPPNIYFTKSNATLLKGIVWLCRGYQDRRTIHLIADLCEKCMKKLPDSGIASLSTANACLYFLEETPGVDVAARLSRLMTLLRQKGVKDRVQAAIEAKAIKAGLTATQIEERVVPDYGLNAGEKTVGFDSYDLRIIVEGPGRVAQTWTKPDGTALKAKPKLLAERAVLRTRYDKLKAEVATLKKITTAQRDRIDRLFAENLTWSVDELMEFYIDHPLVGVIARRLIWVLGDGAQAASAIYRNDAWEGVNGQPVHVRKDSSARLWHPIDCPVKMVMAWRARLAEIGLGQPLKQAHREIYLLTDAERATEVYSNRMAAHVLKQHQMANLMGTRGWSYRLMGAFDDGAFDQFATKSFASSSLRAEYLIHKKWDEEHVTDMGMLVYVGTDQLRFVGAEGNPVALASIGTRMFSETMRDADLFVGVASVGSDPEWYDQGPTPEARDYWHGVSFGELDAFAETRKEVLNALLPRLNIRDRVHIDGRYLIVEGRLNTYKIHLGSSNILMVPGDRYLCIVPKGRSTPADIALPFEGDQRLSVILSKVLMLADDDKITDPVIVSQLGR